MDLSNTNFPHVETTGALDTPTRSSPEREIVCVTLRKDQKLGFGEDITMAGLIKPLVSVVFSQEKAPVCFSGFVIVGEDNTGKLDLGIFIASIVPDGPADRDGRIKPGTSTRICYRKIAKWEKWTLIFSLFLQEDVSFL